MTDKKAYEKMKEYKGVELPWEVYRLIPSAPKQMEVWGDQASVGEDYASLEEWRAFVEFFADQFGGKVKWKK